MSVGGPLTETRRRVFPLFRSDGGGGAEPYARLRRRSFLSSFPPPLVCLQSDIASLRFFFFFLFTLFYFSRISPRPSPARSRVRRGVGTRPLIAYSPYVPGNTFVPATPSGYFRRGTYTRRGKIRVHTRNRPRPHPHSHPTESGPHERDQINSRFSRFLGFPAIFFPHFPPPPLYEGSGPTTGRLTETAASFRTGSGTYGRTVTTRSPYDSLVVVSSKPYVTLSPLTYTRMYKYIHV